MTKSIFWIYLKKKISLGFIKAKESLVPDFHFNFNGILLLTPLNTFENSSLKRDLKRIC